MQPGPDCRKGHDRLIAKCHRFVSQRMSRNSDVVIEIATSQGLPEILAVTAKWLQDAVEDYIKQASMLMEANSKLVSGFVPQVGQAFRCSAKAPTRGVEWGWIERQPRTLSREARFPRDGRRRRAESTVGTEEVLHSIG